MYLHYLFSALRHFSRNKSHSAITIMGLAVGLAAVMLILTFIRTESRYDHFHEKAERLYRIGVSYYENGGLRGTDYEFIAAVGPALKEEIPEVEAACCVNSVAANRPFRYGEQEPRMLPEARYVDANFFELFSFPLLQGDPLTALKEPFSLVLTVSEAYAFFGKEEAMGKVLQDEAGRMFTVTGIMQDPPKETELPFKALLSMQTRYSTEPASMFGWNGGNQFNTYVLLRPGTSRTEVEAKVAEMMPKYKALLGDDDWQYVLALQPLKQIHLHHNHESFLLHIYFYVFGGAALLILLIACINFVNLMMARALDYAREVGVRKVLGDGRKGILRLFLTESFLAALLALALALVLACMALPIYNQISGQELSLTTLLSWGNLLTYILLWVVIGLGAGLYPALYLSSFQPAMVEKSNRGKSSGLVVRNVLIVFQFIISIVLVVMVLALSRQLRYTQTLDLGFDKENVLCVSTPKASLLKEALQNRPYVKALALSSYFPGLYQTSNGYQIEGHDGWKMVKVIEVEADFLDLYNIPLRLGQNFSGDVAVDRNYVLVNERFTQVYNWEDPIGKRIQRGRLLRVQGVIQDLYMEPLRNSQQPFILACHLDDADYRCLSLKYQTHDMAAMLQDIKRIWDELHPVRPFQYSFLGDRILKTYDYEQHFRGAFFWFALFAILLAVLGVYSLMSYTVSRRRKEIGIRKVLGASVGDIMFLLSKGFLRLVLIANIIAIPTAWFGVSKLLQLTAYHIPMGWLMFVGASLVSFMVAALALAWQAFRAARANPVNSISKE